MATKKSVTALHHGRIFSMVDKFRLDACQVYLGHDMLVYGSVLSLLVHHVLPNADPLLNLKQIWADIQSYYQRYTRYLADIDI